MRVGGGGSPDPRGLQGAGWGSNKEPLLPRSRPAGSRPSRSPQSGGGAGRQCGGVCAPGPPPPLPPRRPLAPGEGGEEGGACVFVRRAPRLLSGSRRRRSRLSSRGCRSCRLHTAWAAGAGLGSGGRARGPGGTPGRAAEEAPGDGGGGGGGGGVRLRRPRDPIGLSAPSQPFFRSFRSYSRPAPLLCARRWCSPLAAPRSRRPLVSRLPAASPPLEDGPPGLGASRVSRLLGKPRRRRHHE